VRRFIKEELLGKEWLEELKNREGFHLTALPQYAAGYAGGHAAVAAHEAGSKLKGWVKHKIKGDKEPQEDQQEQERGPCVELLCPGRVLYMSKPDEDRDTDKDPSRWQLLQAPAGEWPGSRGCTTYY
jgi:hypothetical protein